VKRLTPVLIPLAGLGVFWLLSEPHVSHGVKSHVSHGVIWGLLIGCAAVGLAAAIAGFFVGKAQPLLAAVLLYGWALFVVAAGVVIATIFYYLALKIGDHIGGPDNATTKITAAGLGVAVGALVKIVYDALPQIGYPYIARWTLHFRYENKLPNASGNMDAGFLAGWAAIKYTGGGSIPFPATWSIASSRPDPGNAELRTIPVKGWTIVAVRRRLILIKKAIAKPSGNVTIVGKTDVEMIRKLADLIDQIAPTLQLGTEPQADLVSRVTRLRAVANDPAASDPAPKDPAAQRELWREALGRVLRLTDGEANSPAEAHAVDGRPHHA